MADVIPFAGSNTDYMPAPGDEGRVGMLPAFKAANGEVISCWRLTGEERAQVAETGEVWLSVATGGQKLPPCKVSGAPLMTLLDEHGQPIPGYRSDVTLAGVQQPPKP